MGMECVSPALWADDGHVLHHVCHLYGVRLEEKKLGLRLDRSVSFVFGVLDSAYYVRFQVMEGYCGCCRPHDNKTTLTFWRRIFFFFKF
jgi:hypothetical protein